MKGALQISWHVAVLALAGGPSCLPAHDSLYHYVELTLPRGEAGGQIVFSVHPGDLAAAVTMGADATGSDLSWLGDEESAGIAVLLDEAKECVLETFFLSIDGKPSDGGGLRFPDVDCLRSGAADAEAARPGFLAASINLDKAVSAVSLRLSPTSGKRLLFVVNRPGAFPLVRDLAPGETTTFALTDS